jgi:hypothetical protein
MKETLLMTTSIPVLFANRKKEPGIIKVFTAGAKTEAAIRRQRIRRSDNRGTSNR